jgi:hypothetical protein
MSYLDWCRAEPLCFELAKGVPAALVALIIGLVAAGIAWRQYQVARAKFKLDLFEKRYDIFFKTWGHLSSMINNGLGPTPLSDFDNEGPKAAFLFGSDIEAYMKEVSSNRIKLWTVAQATTANGGVLPPKHIAEHTALLEWFFQEGSEGVKKKFAPYLDFSNWT